MCDSQNDVQRVSELLTSDQKHHRILDGSKSYVLFYFRMGFICYFPKVFATQMRESGKKALDCVRTSVSPTFP